MSNLHICWTRGTYVAQVRSRGARLWRTVAKRCRSERAALCRAVRAMGRQDNRARVLLCQDWYEPLVVMEATRG